jgi:hypothetical protein
MMNRLKIARILFPGGLLFVLFLFFSCTERKSKARVEAPVNLPKKEFVLVDSIVIQPISTLYFVIADYNVKRQTYLAFDPLRSNVIFEFDQTGKINHTLDLQRTDGSGIGNYLFGLGYYRDSLLCLISEKGCYIYNTQGQRLQFIKGAFGGNSANFGVQLVNDVVYCPLINTKSSSNNFTGKRYYEAKRNLMGINLRDSSLAFHAPFENGSIYLDNEVWYNKSLVASTYDNYDSTLKLIYQLDNKMYQYNLSDNGTPVLKKVVDLVPEYFGEISGLEYDGKYTQPDLLKLNAENSAYNQIHSFNDSVVIVYSVGVPKEELKSLVTKGTVGLNQLLEKDYQEYVSIYYKDKKLYRDIKVPENCAGIVYVQSANRFLMLRRKTTDNVGKNDKEIAYIYEIR